MSETNIERRSEWQFTISEEGWGWVRRDPDGTQQQAARLFKTLQEAADDARSHGYAAWQADERRSADRDL